MIPDLPPLYVDHLVTPHGQEDLPDAEAMGQQGSMVGGTGVRVTLLYREGSDHRARIRAASVRVFGSPAPLAPASYLSEIVVGMTPEQAQDLDPKELMEALAGRHAAKLPAPVHKGAAFAIDALHCALGLPGCRPSDPEGDGILVCRCLSVGDRRIRAAIAAGAVTPEAIGEHCGAATGCRSCRPDLLHLLHEERGEAIAPPPRHLHPLARITLSRVGPVLGAQGRHLRDVRVTEDRVQVVLAETDDPRALLDRSAVAIARHLLRETVSEALLVEQVPPA